MDKESWTSMITHQGKGKLPDEVEGSHGCGIGLAAGAPPTQTAVAASAYFA